MHVLCRTLCPDAYDAVCHRGRGVVSATTTAGYAEAWRGATKAENGNDGNDGNDGDDGGF